MNDPLGDRMKLYESAEAGRRLMPLLPVLARVDGRAFHSFTRDMMRPFDGRFRSCMIRTAMALMEETGAAVSYLQSDEISLAWYSSDFKSRIWFDGRVAKMTSQLAAQATLEFNLAIADAMPAWAPRRPTFDARVWNVPTLDEAVNVFLWREQDAVRNSIQMMASALYGHKELHGCDLAKLHDMLHAKGVNWNDQPDGFKRGVYVRRLKSVRRFTTEELDRLPARHAARSNPDLEVERTTISAECLPPLGRIANPAEVLFQGAVPVMKEPAPCS